MKFGDRDSESLWVPQGCPPACVPDLRCFLLWRPLPVPLPPPQALTLATVTPRTIHLTWQPSAGATQYLVRYSLASPKGEEEGREVRDRGWRRQLGPVGWGAR